MAIELIKVRPRPDHFHHDGQAVCERCMSKLASSGSPLYDAVSEYFYVSKQLLFILAESIFQFAIWLLEQTKEHIYIANEILLIIAKFVLFASMGIGMAVAALFPSVAGGKSAYEEELDKRYKEKKQREWERRQEDLESSRAFDQLRDQEFQSKRADFYARDDEELVKFQKTRDKVNSPVYNGPKIVTTAESAEDEYLVKRANSRLKGVENGTESIEDLRKDADEVFRHRCEAAAKDERRRDLLNRCRDKDWEAQRLYDDAEKAFNRGDDREGEGLVRRGDSARRDANALYNEYLTV